MKSYNDSEIQTALQQEIAARKVLVHEDNQSYFDEIEKNYPISFNKIDWSVKNNIHYENLQHVLETEKRERINNFLNNISKELPDLMNDSVYVFGDDLLNFVYEMSYKDFIKIFDHFFEIPQHTYILFKKSRKCINYTFEDELFFG